MEEPPQEQELPPTTTATATVQRRRRICSGVCERPVNVCLCNHITSKPISTNTHIIILQHPHELRQKLATVPVLNKCIDINELIVGRKLKLGSSPLLDNLFYGVTDSSRCVALFLFPDTKSLPSVDINKWKATSNYECIDELVLIVFDGTWTHAKEMVQASLPFLSKFATGVCFGCDYNVGGRSIYDSDLTLKKEPYKGCMSTLEAVARALRVLEPNGIEIEAKLLEVLKSMVSMQASYLMPMKPRLKPLKKGDTHNNIKLPG